ncbi:MAG: hypothetical protein HN348_03780 [Proteobacteria bacterium]|jgi:hypothetical protein|nr:hypothetical protein [Pseudomonadota bacterium]
MASKNRRLTPQNRTTPQQNDAQQLPAQSNQARQQQLNGQQTSNGSTDNAQQARLNQIASTGAAGSDESFAHMISTIASDPKSLALFLKKVSDTRVIAIARVLMSRGQQSLTDSIHLGVKSRFKGRLPSAYLRIASQMPARPAGVSDQQQLPDAKKAIAHLGTHTLADLCRIAGNTEMSKRMDVKNNMQKDQMLQNRGSAVTALKTRLPRAIEQELKLFYAEMKKDHRLVWAVNELLRRELAQLRDTPTGRQLVAQAGYSQPDRQFTEPSQDDGVGDQTDQTEIATRRKTIAELEQWAQKINSPCKEVKDKKELATCQARSNARAREHGIQDEALVDGIDNDIARQRQAIEWLNQLKTMVKTTKFGSDGSKTIQFHHPSTKALVLTRVFRPNKKKGGKLELKEETVPPNMAITQVHIVQSKTGYTKTYRNRYGQVVKTEQYTSAGKIQGKRYEYPKAKK